MGQLIYITDTLIREVARRMLLGWKKFINMKMKYVNVNNGTVIDPMGTYNNRIRNKIFKPQVIESKMQEMHYVNYGTSHVTENKLINWRRFPDIVT